jgi:hypothetical protein
MPMVPRYSFVEVEEWHMEKISEISRFTRFDEIAGSIVFTSHVSKYLGSMFSLVSEVGDY